MTLLRDKALFLFLSFGLLAYALPLGEGPSWASLPSSAILWAAAMALGACSSAVKGREIARLFLLVAASAAGAAVPLGLISRGVQGAGALALWSIIFALGFLIWRTLERTGTIKAKWPNAVVPALFGLWLLYLWQVLTSGFAVPKVLLPPPSDVGLALAASWGTLAQDFVQTFVKSVVPGYALGNLAGFATALLVDRFPFFQRGLLPLGNLFSSLPIVGLAPIMVMWFGFDWESKAAIVVAMTFFPMLVNAITGLSQTTRFERDLMQTYAASYSQTLWKVRLPAALPFLFNAFKINSTLALIGAIVAEFFGSPTVGLGFRISTEAGRMNIVMVWAAIAVAACAGSAFYGFLALLERRSAFWHPSFRPRG